MAFCTDPQMRLKRRKKFKTTTSSSATMLHATPKSNLRRISFPPIPIEGQFVSQLADKLSIQGCVNTEQMWFVKRRERNS
jgi:hypothetical protein